VNRRRAVRNETPHNRRSAVQPPVETHRTVAASLLRQLIHAFAPRMPICVCAACVLPTDEIVATAGDFSLCDRCRASITSATGVAVRARAAIRPEDS
jgi:hypothetical protein